MGASLVLGDFHFFVLRPTQWSVLRVGSTSTVTEVTLVRACGGRLVVIVGGSMWTSVSGLERVGGRP